MNIYLKILLLELYSNNQLKNILSIFPTFWLKYLSNKINVILFKDLNLFVSEKALTN